MCKPGRGQSEGDPKEVLKQLISQVKLSTSSPLYCFLSCNSGLHSVFCHRLSGSCNRLSGVCNRYSQRAETRAKPVEGQSEGDSKEVLDLLIKQAKAAFGSDRVWAAEDFFTFQIKPAQLPGKR